MFYYADYRQAFGHAPFFGYLAQTWSLSVEEQFYILWSLAMVAAVAAAPARLAYGFAVVGMLALDGRPAVPRLPRPPLRQRGVRPRRTTPSTRGPTPSSSGACSACWPPTATSTGGPGGPAGLITVAAAGSAVFLCWILLYAPL